MNGEDAAWYIAYPRTRPACPVAIRTAPSGARAQSLGSDYLVLLGPMDGAAAKWGASHVGEWLTVSELVARTGHRTQEDVEVGL